ncbi:hypothetical protein [Leptospira noguchii]|uniref:hypothetical protein n=1 Tax=Leptospira noguchii TaxID=28182 RepID=UPI000328468E|nr:hypothetical protein LEP1GSC074_2258 [Leptospira noguchii str. Hook]
MKGIQFQEWNFRHFYYVVLQTRERNIEAAAALEKQNGFNPLPLKQKEETVVQYAGTDIYKVSIRSLSNKRKKP